MKTTLLTLTGICLAASLYAIEPGVRSGILSAEHKNAEKASAATELPTTILKEDIVVKTAATTGQIALKDNIVDLGITEIPLTIGKIDPGTELPANIKTIGKESWRLIETKSGNTCVLRIPAGQICTDVREWNAQLLLTFQVKSGGEVYHQAIMPQSLDQLSSCKAGAKMNVMIVPVPSMGKIENAGGPKIDGSGS